jgi:putative transposase
MRSARASPSPIATIGAAHNWKELTLSALEFIRRLSLHILPSGLVRIRHYGILGNNRRKRAIEATCAILQRCGLARKL